MSEGKRRERRGKTRARGRGRGGTGRANLKLEEQQRRRRKRAALAVALILAIGLASYLLFSQRQGAGPLDRSMIKVTPRVYDFGTVSQARGVVTAELTLENRGGSDLIITGIQTSCGCTQASLIIGGEEGPRFGMHNNPVGWRARLAPGEQGLLKVYYDPNVHGEIRGPVTREIEIYSNDSNSPVYTVRIKLVQTE